MFNWDSIVIRIGIIVNWLLGLGICDVGFLGLDPEVGFEYERRVLKGKLEGGFGEQRVDLKGREGLRK